MEVVCDWIGFDMKHYLLEIYRVFRTFREYGFMEVFQFKKYFRVEIYNTSIYLYRKGAESVSTQNDIIVNRFNFLSSIPNRLLFCNRYFLQITDQLFS